MSHSGKLLGVLTAAVLLGAFALPASAANKTITLSVTPIPAPLSPETTVVSAIIANTGNSNANSFEIDWTTSPYFTVTGASADGTPGDCSLPAAGGSGYSSCIFLKQLPTKSSVTITLNVQVNNQCNAMSIGWEAYAWTGAPGSVSQSFALKSTPPVTASSPNCTIQFVTQPKDTFSGSTITGEPLNSTGDPVTVQLQSYGTAVVGTTVSVSASPLSCVTTSPLSATTDASGNATVEFTAATANSCVLSASATGFGSVDSQSFNVVQPAGELGCDSTNNAFGTTDASTGLVLNGTRLGNVDDPLAEDVTPTCVVVPYVISTTCPTGVTATACTNFVYDPLNQGTHMAFAFHWEWPPEAIPSNGIEGIQNTQQLFINGNPVPLELDLCPEITPAFDSNGVFIGLDPTSAPPSDQDSFADGTQAGCLVHRDVKQLGDQQIQLIEDAYVQGDYASARN